MERYKRILVCIDRPQRDAHILDYVLAIARLAKTEEIHVVHFTEHEAGGSDEASADAPAPAGITPEALRALVGDRFQEFGKDACRCEIVHGPPLLEALRFAHDRDIDLMTIGRDYGELDEAESEAVLARRITRKATCSVLVLPEDCDVKADAILVPVRDSECSANALDVACGIAVATNAVVTALNVYQVNPGYSRVGTTLEEHEALLEAAAEHETERLLQRVDTGQAKTLTKCAADHHGKPARIILDAINEVPADLVVIGARGRTGAAGVLLGNITEQLIRESPVPVLAVKKKGECLGIVRALLTLAGEG
jgi:nucleotide-binding universal stress UspA family protein